MGRGWFAGRGSRCTIPVCALEFKGPGLGREGSGIKGESGDTYDACRAMAVRKDIVD